MEKQLPALMKDEPDIKEYLEALLQGGKEKEVKETKELLDYLDIMDQKFTELIDEVASLKETIQTLQNPETRTRLSTIADTLEHAVKRTKELINDTKESFRTAVKQSLVDFKSKGKQAVIKTVETLHFKDALHHIGRLLAFVEGGVAAFNVKVNEISVQSRQIKNNFKNIGRIMIGKEVQPYQLDKAKLNTLQRLGKGLSNKLETLYVKTMSTCKRLENTSKSSVKKDLKQINNNKSNEIKLSEKTIPLGKDR